MIGNGRVSAAKALEIAHARTEILMTRGVDLYNRKLVVGIPYMEHNPDADVSFALAANVLTGLDALETMYLPKPGEEPLQHITIDLTSYGGDLYHSLGIFNRIRACTVPVHVRVFGPCMSGGSLILQAAERRLLYPSSRMMIHYGFTADEGTSNPNRLREVLREHDSLMDHMVEIYLERADQAELAKDMRLRLQKDLEEVGCTAHAARKALAHTDEAKMAESMLRRVLLPIESYLDASDAVRYGFADEMVTP